MAINELKPSVLRNMFICGANNLSNNKDLINELNVFPVPDGDTGTNMTMTILSAMKELQALPEDADVEAICKAVSSGSLRGARGNSGVILSQLLRGFCKSVKEEKVIDDKAIASAFTKAVDTAYKAVMKPKEGTILTVAKAAAEAAVLAAEDSLDFEEFGKRVIDAAQVALDNTPELLPVLKEAGVVDSGGKGLLEVLKGAYDGMMGKTIQMIDTSEATTANLSSGGFKREHFEGEDDIKFGYCTEFIVLLEKVFNSKAEKDFKSFLESIGDSIVCVADEDVLKIHVHTNDPGLAIQRGLRFGELTSIKIDNMREEHRETLFEKQAEKAEIVKEEPKDFGFVSVSTGDGLEEIFKGLGADYVISGGQTMNPSTEDILAAVDTVNAKTVFILPNNKNIILAANQAKDICEDKQLIVIPTKTIPQGITAMINFDPSGSAEDNEECMSEEIKNVKSGQITYAVRDTVIDGVTIKINDIMGIGDQGILSVGKDCTEVMKGMLDKLVDEDSSLISIYYGEDVNEEEADAMSAMVSDAYPELDVEFNAGGQSVYYYLLSVE